MPKDDLHNYVGQVHPDDGVAPRRKERRQPSSDRKLRALCSQVRRTLDLLVPADLGLIVLDVVPDADPARLIVLLQADGGPGDLAELHARVAVLAPAFRREVARAITRKRAPDLSYRISPRRALPELNPATSERAR